MKKTILAYGDSNTWGWRPDNTATFYTGRWSDEERWTGVLQKELGEEYHVITEGLTSRTTVFDDPIEENRCGKDQILPIMDSQGPIDLMIIFLGTNDLKNRFHVTAADIAQGAGLLVQKALAQKSAFRGEPKVLLLAPPRLNPNIANSWNVSFWGSEEKSTQLGGWYAQTAELLGVEFVDTDKIIKSSDRDGLHLEKDQHKILGEAIAKKVKEIM